MTVACFPFSLHSVPYLFFYALNFTFWNLLFRFPFTILTQSVSTHILCKIRFNVFNFFTSRAHNVAKKAIWTRSIHLWAEQTSRVCSAHSHSHSESEYIYLYLLFRCLQHRYNTIFLTLVSVFVRRVVSLRVVCSLLLLHIVIWYTLAILFASFLFYTILLLLCRALPCLAVALFIKTNLFCTRVLQTHFHF